MQHAALFRDMLERADVAGVRRLLPEIMPHFPPPKTTEEVEVTLHMARTACELLALQKRAWSHAWLSERGYPSQLPDILKPAAERMYPRVVEAVGVAVKAGSPERAPLAKAVQGAMAQVVEEMYAEGDRDPVLVRQRMFEARAKVYKQR